MAVIAPQSEFQYKYLNCDSNIIVAGGAMGCVPAETEFLTPKGWKKISEYKSGDLVGTVSFADNNKNSLLLFFAEPYEFIKLPCERMTYVEKDGVRKTLSGEHRVVHWKDGRFVVDVWEELVRNNKEIEIRNSIDSTTMNLGDIRYFVKQFIGNKKNNSFNEFVTDCKDTADGIQLAFVTSGVGAQIRENNGSYTIKVVENTYKLFGKGSEIGEVKTSDGFKYCFTVDTGFFLIRENGNVFVTGNSSKSYIGLMRHLRWAEDPYYRGYCIRKNSTTLMKPSGLFEEALDLYRKYDERVIPKLKDQKIVFPSGATVAFSHYENDKASELYRGLQLSSAFYDEATDSQERHIWFLISRLRTKAKMTPSIWLTCNPDPDHYLRDWVDWWLYPEGHPKFGLPDPEKNGKERYILRLGDDLHWGDSKEELIEKFGNPRLPIDHPRQPKPLSITVLLGTVN